MAFRVRRQERELAEGRAVYIYVKNGFPRAELARRSEVSDVGGTDHEPR
jgi:hypothetical protein